MLEEATMLELLTKTLTQTVIRGVTFVITIVGAAGNRGDPVEICPGISTAGPAVQTGQSETFMQTVDDGFRLGPQRSVD